MPHSALGGSGSGVQVYGGGRGRVQSTQPSRTRSQNRWTATQKQMGGENIGRTVYISEIDQQVCMAPRRSDAALKRDLYCLSSKALYIYISWQRR